MLRPTNKTVSSLRWLAVSRRTHLIYITSTAAQYPSGSTPNIQEKNFEYPKPHDECERRPATHHHQAYVCSRTCLVSNQRSQPVSVRICNPIETMKCLKYPHDLADLAIPSLLVHLMLHCLPLWLPLPLPRNGHTMDSNNPKQSSDSLLTLVAFIPSNFH